jgi:hypothetical protein
MNFTIYNTTTGEIKSWGSCQDSMVEYEALESGEAIFTGESYTSSSHYFLAGVPTAYTAPQVAGKANRPEWRGVWSNTTMAWVDVRALADAKALKRTQINEWRFAANRSTFDYDGKTFACDALSRSDIDAVQGRVARFGSLPAWFPGVWKAVDNTYKLLNNVDLWDAFYDAMCQQGTTNFFHSQDLKDAVTAATTLAEVEAVVW